MEKRNVSSIIIITSSLLASGCREPRKSEIIDQKRSPVKVCRNSALFDIDIPLYFKGVYELDAGTSISRDKSDRPVLLFGDKLAVLAPGVEFDFISPNGMYAMIRVGQDGIIRAQGSCPVPPSSNIDEENLNAF